jgi:hypothetical protein
MKYDVNYSAVAADVAKSKVGERLRSKIEERLGGAKPPAEQPSGQGGSAETRDPRRETIDKLKGLFGR